jgi:hypothetical protein
MAAMPQLRTPDATGVRSSLPEATTHLLTIVILITIIAAITMTRGGLLERPTGLDGGAENATPAELTTAAADVLDQAGAVGGAGYTFSVVQSAAMVAREGSEGIEVGDPADPTKVLLVERHDLATYLERGVVSDAGFASEIRRSADDLTKGDGWDGAPMELAALVVDGVMYRNDGAGWYETSQPPGIGLDPASARLLPDMLRNVEGTADAPVSEGATDALTERLADLQPARTLAGTARVDDLPGIIAVDLAEATELIEPVSLAFDADGRLIGLKAVARNIHVETHDLVITTVITFEYPERAPALPKPEPRHVEPSPAPDSDEPGE